MSAPVSAARSPATAPSVGLLGLGIMGWALAGNLIKARVTELGFAPSCAPGQRQRIKASAAAKLARDGLGGSPKLQLRRRQTENRGWEQATVNIEARQMDMKRIGAAPRASGVPASLQPAAMRQGRSGESAPHPCASSTAKIHDNH